MKSPFYTVFVAGKNVTAHVTALTYEDCIKEDDIVKIDLKNIPEDFVHHFREGQKITFQFGYHQGDVSPLHQAYIQKIDPAITVAGTWLSIKALDKGQFLKRTKSSKTWVNKTTSEIITEIAQSHGLDTSQIQKTDYVHPSYSQGSKNDMEAIRELLRQEKSGSFRSYIKNNILVFEDWDLKQEPQFELVLSKNGDGNLISFGPRTDTNHDNVASGTQVKSNPISLNSGTFGEQATENKQLQGKYPAVGTNKAEAGQSIPIFDAETLLPISTKKPPKKKEKVEKPAKTLLMPSGLDQKQILGRQNHHTKKSSAGAVTADFKIEGTPVLLAGKGSIKVKGVGSKHDGNWDLLKVVHSLQSNSPYTTSGKLSRNALGKPSSKGAAKQPKTYKDINKERIKSPATTAKKPKQAKQMPIYDAETLKRIN